jgi:hypothetical protein
MKPSNHETTMKAATTVAALRHAIGLLATGEGTLFACTTTKSLMIR